TTKASAIIKIRKQARATITASRMPLAAPILFGLSVHCWRFRIPDLHPMRSAARAVRAAKPLRYDTLATYRQRRVFSPRDTRNAWDTPHTEDAHAQIGHLHNHKSRATTGPTPCRPGAAPQQRYEHKVKRRNN